MLKPKADMFGSITVILLLVPFSIIKGECLGKADVVIAVPGSSVVPDDDFNEFESQLIDLISYFTIEPDQFNIGLLLYGKHTVTIATPQPFKNRVQMNTRITLLTQRRMHYWKLGMEQDVASAIREVRHMLTSPPDGYNMNILRTDARKIGILFLYGPTPPKKEDLVVAAAQKAKTEDHILLYALIAGGSGADFPLIGTDYCRLFSMKNFHSGLRDAMKDLAHGVCASLSPIPLITPNRCFPGRYKKARRIGVTCQVEKNKMQPDPNNCAYYYRCEYLDTSPIKGKCPDSTLYDPLTMVCNMKNNVACYNDLKCPKNEPMLHPHPLDCTKFLNCFNDLIPHVQSCPKHQVFDPDHGTCNQTAFGSCITPLKIQTDKTKEKKQSSQAKLKNRFRGRWI